jgi:hypothetical protein
LKKGVSWDFLRIPATKRLEGFFVEDAHEFQAIGSGVSSSKEAEVSNRSRPFGGKAFSLMVS